jgi:cytochrome c-type biogenesis protein CcmH/NrfF
LFKIYEAEGGLGGVNVLILILVYSVAIAASVLVPVWSVHKKAEAEKERELRELRKALLEVNCQARNINVASLLLEANLRNKCRDILAVNTWPLIHKIS